MTLRACHESDRPILETESVIDLRRLHRATDFAASLAATELRWPELAGEIVSQVARLVGDGAALFLRATLEQPLTLQAADHHRRADARQTWVDLAALGGPITQMLDEMGPGQATPRRLRLSDAPALRAGARGGWPLPRRPGDDGDSVPCVIVAPLVVGHEQLGALVVARDQSSPDFDETDLDFTADLALRAAVAVHDSRLVRGARAAARKAAESDAISRAILQSAIDAVIVIDDAGRIDSVNPAAESLSGYSAAELVGRDVELLMPTDQRERGKAMLASRASDEPNTIVGQRREVGLRRRDGTEEPVELSMSAVQVGERRLFVGIARDVTQRKQEEEQLRTAAQADTLTGLVNRASFHRALVQRMERDDDRSFGLLFLDLDGFKAINDSFGHPVGDQVLQEVGARLTDAVRRYDIVARYGGDEFVVVVGGERDANHDVEAVSNRIRRAFGKPFMVGGVTLPLDVSIGSALYPADGHTISALITAADRAMYAEKRSKPTLETTSTRRTS